MKNKIFKLEYQRCADFLYDYLHGWQYFTNILIEKNKVKNGDFYVIVQDDFDSTELYQFESAKGMEQPRKELAFFINNLINGRDNFFYVAEDGSRSPSDLFIINAQREYYLADDTMFYLRKKGDTVDSIMECFNYFGGYGFFSILVNNTPPLINAKQNINKQMENIILENVCMTFTEVYDGESYLVWVRDGYSTLIENNLSS